MIEYIRQRLNTPAPWIAIAGIMVSGTVALIGFWVTFTEYHDDNIRKITTLEEIVRSNTAWRAKLEIEHQDLVGRINKLEGRLDEHIREDDRRLGEIQHAK